MKKVSIIGSGNIGGNLGLHLTKAGYEVLFSSRHPHKLNELSQQAGPLARTGSIIEAAQFSDMVVFAVPFKALPELADQIGDQLKGKTIVDTSNPYPKRDGEIATKLKKDKSRRETQLTVDLFPQSSVVKVLNTIYYLHLRDFAFLPQGQRYALPMAGTDASAKVRVTKILHDIGFEVVDIGGIKDSRIMEVDQPLYNNPLTKKEIEALLAH
ncbi:MAG: NADPH-dependent F420 reductase [Candidatus Cyclobacteriaceae bacterium M3_2C_046]